MTKDQLQAELKEKIKTGIKPSDLKKLKRSKSADDIASSPTPNIPLKKSQSQLVIPIVNQPTPSQQISQLKQTLTFTQTTAQNYLKNLQLAQAKITELEEELKAKEIFTDALEENPVELKEKITNLEQQILQLRLEKIKEFGDYYEKKQELEKELNENIDTGTAELERLENKLLTTNKKKLELAQKLGTSQSKVAELELKLLNSQPATNSPSFWTDYWPLLLIALLYCCSAWLLSKNPPEN